MVTERKTVNRQQQLRELLKPHRLGLSEETVYRLMQETSPAQRRRTVAEALRGMDDAYIARWVHSPTRRKYVPVWVVADVPDDAPMPTLKPPPQATYNKVIRK